MNFHTISKSQTWPTTASTRRPSARHRARARGKPPWLTSVAGQVRIDFHFTQTMAIVPVAMVKLIILLPWCVARTVLRWHVNFRPWRKRPEKMLRFTTDRYSVSTSRLYFWMHFQWTCRISSCYLNPVNLPGTTVNKTRVLLFLMFLTFFDQFLGSQNFLKVGERWTSFKLGSSLIHRHENRISTTCWQAGYT